jgi:hypothetical protein
MQWLSGSLRFRKSYFLSSWSEMFLEDFLIQIELEIKCENEKDYSFPDY